MNRRAFLKASGAAVALATAAGCAEAGPGGGEDQNVDQGDEPVQGEGAGLFDFEPAILEEQMGQEVRARKLQLFRTAEAVGLLFTLVNPRGNALTSVTAHARLLDENDEVIDTFGESLEAEHIDDLAVGETWRGDIIFEGFTPEMFGQDVAGVEFWATAEAQSD